MKYHKSLAQNMILNTIKQICSVAFPMITFPYVAHILGAENYGKINFGSSIIIYFSLIAALGIQNYSVREGTRIRDNKLQLTLFAKQVFSINIITTIISYSLLFVLLIASPKLQAYRILILIQSLSILFSTIGCDWINVIYEDYMYMTVRYIIIQFLAIICMFVFVRDADDYLIYAAITVAVQSVPAILNLYYIKRYVNIKLIFKNICFWKHLKPMILLLGNALAVNIYLNSDIIILGLFKTDHEVGIYSFSAKIYGIIKQVINGIVITLIPRISYYLGKDDLTEYNELLKKVLHYICIFVIPIVVGLFMISEEVIILVGGKEYESGIFVLKTLSLALLFAVLSYFYTSGILIPNRKEKQCLYATLIGAIVNIGLNFFFIPIFGKNGAAVTTLFAEITVLLVSATYSLKFHDDFKNGKNLLQVMAASIFIVLVCLSVKIMVKKLIIRIILSIIMSGIMYFLCLFIMKNAIIRELEIMIKKEK